MGGYGPWARKARLQHVEPPFHVIESMLTLRIHLDDVLADNAPLLIAPGSHRLGKVPGSEIETVVATCGTRACLAASGDIWAYATAIVHISAAHSMTTPAFEPTGACCRSTSARTAFLLRSLGAAFRVHAASPTTWRGDAVPS